MATKKCPVYGSENIIFDTGSATGGYFCRDCGYRESLIVEEDC